MHSFGVNRWNLEKDNALSNFPSGYIDRVEANYRQITFISRNSSIRTVMVNIDDAEKLLKKGLDSSSFGVTKTVITTSTISDDVLPYFYLEKEAEIVTRFRSNFHVPCDKPVYETQSRNERLYNIRNQVEETLSLKDLLIGTGTKLIPLVKGIQADELLASTLALRKLGFEAFAYYGGQYFGNGRGNKSTDLLTQVNKIVTELNLGYLLLIGVHSSEVLSKMPRAVKAHSSLHIVRINCWNDRKRGKDDEI